MFSYRLFEAGMDRLRPGWRRRAARRRTLWHFPKLLLILGLMGVLWYALFRLVWQGHVLVYPGHAGLLKPYLNQGGGRATAAILLMILPLMAPAAGLSMIATNLFFWCVPPARRAFQREAGRKREMTFRGATGDLAKITFRWLVPIGLGLAVIGALIPVAIG